MAVSIDFPRGDAITHTFSMPADAWSSGGKLRFMAKPAIDDDNTDATAVITQEWDDSVVTDATINGVTYKKYTCYFPPSATNSIISNGAASANYVGEFQWVSQAGVPTTFPPNDPKLTVTVYFDIIRETN
jgi:hypothetical protein